MLPDHVTIDFAEIHNFLRPTLSPNTTLLFEGLPHQTWEAEALESELASKDTIILGSYPLYDEVRVASEEMTRQLVSILSLPGNLTKWRGVKLCGGFHPDWAITFESKAGILDVFLCFGCQELRLFPRGQEDFFLADFTTEAEEQLKTLLSPFNKHRPPRADPREDQFAQLERQIQQIKSHTDKLRTLSSDARWPSEQSPFLGTWYGLDSESEIVRFTKEGRFTQTTRHGTRMGRWLETIDGKTILSLDARELSPSPEHSPFSPHFLGHLKNKDLLLLSGPIEFTSYSRIQVSQ